jgi:hypothetical protein
MLLTMVLWVHGWMGGRRDGGMGGWVGLRNGWMGGRKDGWMGGFKSWFH